MIDLTPSERQRLHDMAERLVLDQDGDPTATPTPAWDAYVAASRPGVILSLLDQIERLERELAARTEPTHA